MAAGQAAVRGLKVFTGLTDNLNAGGFSYGMEKRALLQEEKPLQVAYMKEKRQ